MAIADLFAAVAVTDFDAMQAWNERLMGITFGRPRAPQSVRCWARASWAGGQYGTTAD